MLSFAILQEIISCLTQDYLHDYSNLGYILVHSVNLGFLPPGHDMTSHELYQSSEFVTYIWLCLE